MGGMGSGVAAGETAKGTTETAHRVDVAYMRREGLLEPGAVGTLSWSCRGRRTGWIRYRVTDPGLRLIYSADGEPLDYPVRVSRTPCHFGGSRVWLHCPVVGCGRRVRILYGGRYFTCRQCAGLVYASTRESVTDLHARRAERIGDRLGWSGGLLDGIEGERPKGMHRRTYFELAHAHHRHRMAYLRAVDARFGMGLFDHVPARRS